MRIGLGVSEDLPIGDQARLAREVEDAGLASLWTNEARGRDALLVCHAWAAATSELEVGIGVVPIWTRSIAQLGAAAMTLQEASGGRFLLGVGVGHPATMEPWHGVGFARPRAAAREALGILRQVTSGQTTDVAGEVLSSRRFRLQMTPLPPAPALLLAAMGPRMLALAGRDADGVLLNWSSVAEVATAAAAVRSAAEGAERQVAAYVRFAVSADRDRARRALAREVGAYCALPAYAEHFERQGLGAMVASARDAHRRGGADAVADELDPEDLAQVGWWGSPDDDVVGVLAGFREAGLDHLVARVVVVDDVVTSVKAVAAVLASAT